MSTPPPGPASTPDGSPEPAELRVPGPGPDAVDLLEPDDVPARRELPITAKIEDKPVYKPQKHERRVRLLVLLTACTIFLPNLGAFGLWDPWETHYGAVTTEMLETHDWISPWWGYRDQVVEGERQGEPFYSKPIFIFWSEAMIASVIGRGEWAIRLPCALLAIMAVYLTYLSLSRIYGRRAGLLAAGVLATSPFFYLVSRQAQTDMPFVATMTLAMLFLLMAFFGPRLQTDNRRFWRWTVITGAFIALNALPQYALLVSDFSFPSGGAVAGFPRGLAHQGWFHALIYLVVLGLWATHVVVQFRREYRAEGLSDAFKDRWFRRYQLFAFYVLVAQASYAKGFLGFLLPGAIILVWLLITWNWRILRFAEIARGIALFCAVGLPWYVAMVVKHGKPYVDRFFWHDQINRLTTGVHQIDSGTFEHFIKWLGVGFFPWVAFVPLALFWLLRLRPRDNDHRNQTLVMLGVWALVSFSLFTSSSTKFHHYILPAVPAMALITALFIRHLFREGAWTLRFATIVGLVFMVTVGVDIKEDPQALRNLMTYKYDRPMPKHLPIDEDAKINDTSELTWKDSYFWKHTSAPLQAILTTKAFKHDTWITLVMVLAGLALCLTFVAKTRIAGLVGLGLTASAMAAWSLSYYLPSLTPHWSQKYLFDSYYDTCNQLPQSDYIREGYEPLVSKIGLGFIADHFRSEPKRICEEDMLAWLITWRGETYYSYNELIPIAKREHFPVYMEKLNGGRKFYIITEKGRQSTIKSEAKSASDALKAKGVPGFVDIVDWEVKVENDESMFFQTVSATPIR